MNDCLKSVLILAGETGSANYIRYLPKILSGLVSEFFVVADGVTKEFLESRNIDVSFDDYSQIPLEHLNPDCIIVGTSASKDYAGLQLIHKCRDLNIPTIGIVDAAMSAFYRFSGRTDNPLFYAPDWVFVVNSQAKKSFLETGYSDNRLIDTGHPHYEDISNKKLVKRNERSLFLEGYIDQNVITFIAEPPVPNENTSRFVGDWPANFYDEERCHVALKALISLNQEALSGSLKILRLHPNNTLADFSPYNQFFEHISTKENATNILRASDIVIGMTSSLMVEAAIMGCHCISIVSREADRCDLPDFIRPNIVQVESLHAFKEAINQNITRTPITLKRSSQIIRRFFYEQIMGRKPL